jgi:hypothetical protein
MIAAGIFFLLEEAAGMRTIVGSTLATEATIGAFGLGLVDLVTGDETFFTSGFAFVATLTAADFLESVFFDGAATFLGAAFTDFFFAVGTVQSILRCYQKRIRQSLELSLR